MDRLKSAGLHIDENESLRIISRESELHSKEAPARCRSLIADLGKINYHLGETKARLLILEEEAHKLRVTGLVTKLIEIQRQSQKYK